MPVQQMAYRKQRLWVIDCMKRISSIVKRFVSIYLGFTGYTELRCIKFET